MDKFEVTRENKKNYCESVFLDEPFIRDDLDGIFFNVGGPRCTPSLFVPSHLSRLGEVFGLSRCQILESALDLDVVSLEKCEGNLNSYKFKRDYCPLSTVDESYFGYCQHVDDGRDFELEFERSFEITAHNVNNYLGSLGLDALNFDSPGCRLPGMYLFSLLDRAFYDFAEERGDVGSIFQVDFKQYGNYDIGRVVCKFGNIVEPRDNILSDIELRRVNLDFEWFEDIRVIASGKFDYLKVDFSK